MIPEESLFGELHITKATMPTDNIFESFMISKGRITKLVRDLCMVEALDIKKDTIDQAAYDILQAIWNLNPDYTFQEKVIASFLLGKWCEQFKIRGGHNNDPLR